MKVGRRRVDADGPDLMSADPMGADASAAEQERRAVVERLGDRLIGDGLATAAQVRAALTEQDRGEGRSLGRLLLEQGAVSEADLTPVLATHYGLELIDLRTITPDPAAVARLSAASARRFTALPIGVTDDDELVVAVADPDAALAGLADALEGPMIVKLAAESDLRRMIDNTYRVLSGVGHQVRAFEARDVIRKDAVRFEAAIADDGAPVVQVVTLIITQGVRDRASDIHIEPQSDRVRVRYRIDGALHDVLDLPGSMGPAIVSRVKILAGLNIVERRRAQDGQIATHVEERAVDIRVSTTAVVGGEKVVMRLLDKSRPLFKLQQLGMPERMADVYRSLLRSPYGMVICAGPTGSGKTTTLYGSLGELNSPERNIMTIEDPVEYTFPSINQIQINEQAGVTFAGGLRSILRQDPDIILVGEVRDVDTARIAVQSALTGHFVLSSLHATDTASALHRLVDMGIETFLVASSVTAVLSQRLVRRVCSYCAHPHAPTREEAAFLRSVPDAPTEGFLTGAGCNFCANTGYLERTGVYELMPITDGIRELIVERATHDDIRKLSRAQGMSTLLQEALRLAADGTTTVGEVMRAIYVVGA
ncbi:MAG: pilus assembly protein PilB [Jatrophihabitantaceae bacterium]|nr:pilus assembly protein PilB [Jatrophihabitantaceae bacterium]